MTVINDENNNCKQEVFRVFKSSKGEIVRAIKYYEGLNIEEINYDNVYGCPSVNTERGCRELFPGDWIVKRNCRDIYVCKDDFDQFFEEIECRKFRKKPIVVEAEQWFPHKDIEGVSYNEEIIPYVRTLEGNMWVRDGDWIITGVNGEKYVCKPDIFEKTYEEVFE